MSDIYNEEYYKNYDVGVEKVNYKDSKYTKDFLEGIADKIIEKYNPKTVLDAGCAMGHLVVALRDKGVEAYGIDISEYAISNVREDIKSFCVVGSLSEELPKEIPNFYDLIITIEVIEHLYEEEGLRAIENLCKYSNNILFSSSPDDIEEITHVNVQQPEYWAKQFAKYNFFNKIDINNDFLTPWTLYFYKSNDISRVIEDYERTTRINKVLNIKKKNQLENENIELQKNNIELQKNNIELQKNNIELQEKNNILEKKNKELEKKSNNLQQKNNEVQQKEIKRITCELNNYKEHYGAAILQRDDLINRLKISENNYNTVLNSTCWKITKPIRITLDYIKKILKGNRYTHLMCKGLKCLKQNGFKYTIRKIKQKSMNVQDYNQYAKQMFFSEEEKKQQINTKFSENIKFSIVVPLYNTPQNFLCEMINSCINQTYMNWELCLADGSDEEHNYVEKVVRNYIKKDKRIKYKRLEQNKGISENTNECIKMSVGDYIALFDHDDLLHPSALFEYMKVIEKDNADLIYSDEAVFEKSLNDIKTIHFKPDFAIDNLRTYNYICHFTVFQKSLLDKVGMFRKEFDGAQDHDMIFRLTEQAENIVHVPKVLYYWRSHPQSTSQDINSKSYAIDNGIKAVNEHLKRCNIDGFAQSSEEFPTIYRLTYEIIDNPMISIIIPNKDNIKVLDTCINSIINKSTYDNFEIVIVENNSTEKETFDYYDKLDKYDNIRIVKYESNGEFNYSAINNYGVRYATGEHLLFLNNDIEVISQNWLQEMLMYSQRKDVGAVGAKLYYENETIQHAGVIIGIGGFAGHSHRHIDRRCGGYFSRCKIQQNLSAVTAACLMMRKNVFEEINGFDESFKVALNDVDLCMRIRKAGYLIAWTPYAELYHYESVSRGYEDTPEKKKRFEGEVKRFQDRWKKELEEGDPYYNPNLTLEAEDFSIK